MFELVGATCRICGTAIVRGGEGERCRACDSPIHTDCRSPSAASGECATCGATLSERQDDSTAVVAGAEPEPLPESVRLGLRPWNPRYIAMLSIFLSILPGGILHAVNYGRLGHTELKRRKLVGNLTWATALFVLAMVLPDGAVVLIWLMSVLIARQFYRTQVDLFQEHIRAGGKTESILVPATITIVCVMLLISGLFAVLAVVPSESDLAFYRGYAHQEAGRYERAIEDYSRAIELDRGYLEAYYNRGSCRSELGQHEQAVQDFSDYLIGDHEDADTWYMRGWSYHALGKWDKAISDYTWSIELGSDDVETYWGRGKSYWQLNKYEQALSDFDAALVHDPNDVPTIYWRARTLLDQGDNTGAIAGFNEVLRLEPMDVDALFQRGLARLDEEAWEPAVTDFSAVIEQADSDYLADSHFNRGLAYEELGKLGAAISDFGEYIRLAPEDADGFKARGIVYVAEDKYEAAVEDLTEAIRLQPDYFAAWRGRAVAHTSMGNDNLAISDLNEAVRLEPDNSTAHELLAWLLATSADAEVRNGAAALRHARRACDLTRHADWSCLDTLAAAFAEAGEFDQAVKWAQEAVRHAPAEEQSGMEDRIKMYKNREPFRESLDAPTEASAVL